MSTIEDESDLINQLSEPSREVFEAASKIDGDVMILGIAGKMGPTLGELLVRAGLNTVIGVSRFSNPSERNKLETAGIRTIRCDLMDDEGVRKLPDAPNIFLLAGFKFGAAGNEPLTWAMNAMLPAKVMQRFPDSRIVYVSSGNVYRFASVEGTGAIESDPLDPVGEYAQSRLAGERLVEYFSVENETPAAIIRLFYATELRYGIILDIAQRVWRQEPIDLSMGSVNQIWQGDANSYLAQSFPLCSSPATVLNLTGPDVLSVRTLANELGEEMKKEPLFAGEEQSTALLGDASEIFEKLGTPKIKPDQMISWVAHWVMKDEKTHGKPTKYESRTGTF